MPGGRLRSSVVGGLHPPPRSPPDSHVGGVIFQAHLDAGPATGGAESHQRSSAGHGPAQATPTGRAPPGQGHRRRIAQLAAEPTRPPPAHIVPKLGGHRGGGGPQPGRARQVPGPRRDLAGRRAHGPPGAAPGRNRRLWSAGPAAPPTPPPRASPGRAGLPGDRPTAPADLAGGVPTAADHGGDHRVGAEHPLDPGQGPGGTVVGGRLRLPQKPELAAVIGP